MYALYGKDNRTPRERILEDELDSYREAESRRMDEEIRKRREQQRERHEEYEEQMRTASDWPEALQKNITLCQRECAGDNESGQEFWNANIAACETAIALWDDVEKSKQGEIEELERRLAAVRDSIKTEVADRLEKSDARREFKDVATALRDSTPSEFLYW